VHCVTLQISTNTTTAAAATATIIGNHTFYLKFLNIIDQKWVIFFSPSDFPALQFTVSLLRLHLPTFSSKYIKTIQEYYTNGKRRGKLHFNFTPK
jgi:hypothetical protein